MSLEAIDTEELKTRLNTILDKADTLLKNIGPVLREVGLIRTEAALIYNELMKRGSLENTTNVKESF